MKHYDVLVNCRGGAINAANSAQDAEPFMQTTSEHGGTFVIGYTRSFDKGRVAVLTPGHTLAVWENPNFQKLFKNAIRRAVSG